VITNTRHSHMLEPGTVRDNRIIEAIREAGVFATAKRAGYAGSIVSGWINGQIYLPDSTCAAICEAAGCIGEWRLQ